MTNTANPDQYDAWNGESGRRWASVADVRDAVLAPVADALFGAADLQSGNAVLDVGCGCGVTTFAAASRVGPSGQVMGIDLSEPMLEVARARARERGEDRVSFVRADAQVHPFEAESVDHVISRFGTMFFADSVAAFGNIAGCLREGGRMNLATWQRREANPWLMVPGEVLARYGSPPPVEPGTPGMFGQADPEAVAATLRSAGFDEIVVEPRDVMFTLGPTPEAAAAYFADTSAARAVFDELDESKRRAALDDLSRALADHHDGDGVLLAGAIWLVAALRD